jgi:L-alanine-DL-glutamate epimerase-like enolase superfamily enzyme
LTPEQQQEVKAAVSQQTGTKPTDVRLRGSELYFLPVETRVPLKFGTETLTSVTCARVRVVVEDREGKLASGWGETPLSVQWVWPSDIGYAYRHNALKDFCEQLTAAWAGFNASGHPVEIGYDFQQRVLPTLLGGFNRDCQPSERMPTLAALVCCSPFDLALHDAFGNLHGLPVYDTYTEAYMNRDLSHYLEAADDVSVDFQGKYPSDFLESNRADQIPVWHLVGGLDPLDSSQLNGDRVDDGEPVLLGDWIEQDGISCLKVKLRGNDAEWDYNRILQVSKIAKEKGDLCLSADFNCTVLDVSYVNEVLDRLRDNEPSVFDSILYVEQPFPYDLESHRIDVHSVAARKPLFMDESAHNWEYVRLGRSLGWNGVALKTCKTQTGALLMLCWAKAHGMHLMVQDLTNPMLAQIPHVLLAAHAGTMKGVESNAMQFYPLASAPEAKVHPGLYRRRNGQLDLSSIHGPGFGYRIDEIERTLDDPVVRCGTANL